MNDIENPTPEEIRSFVMGRADNDTIRKIGEALHQGSREVQQVLEEMASLASKATDVDWIQCMEIPLIVGTSESCAEPEAELAVSLDRLIADLEAGNTVVLASKDFWLNMTIDEEGVMICAFRGATEGSDHFMVEFRRGVEVVCAAEFQNGFARLSLAQLREARSGQADRVRVVRFVDPEPTTEYEEWATGTFTPAAPLKAELVGCAASLVNAFHCGPMLSASLALTRDSNESKRMLTFDAFVMELVSRREIGLAGSSGIVRVRVSEDAVIVEPRPDFISTFASTRIEFRHGNTPVVSVVAVEGMIHLLPEHFQKAMANKADCVCILVITNR